MRYLLFTSLALFVTSLSSALFAQPAHVDPMVWEELKTESNAQMKTIFELADARDYRGFSQVFLYTGRNDKRNYHSLMDYADPYESVEIENELNRIRHWVQKAENYEFAGFRLVKGLENDLYVWDVEFAKKGKIKNHKIFLTQWKDKYVFVRSE